MHDQGVVHGDLKGVRVRTLQLLSRILHHNLPAPKTNILINHDGHACIADFSLLTMVPDQSTFLSSCIQGGTFQWMSPELLDPERFGLKKIRPTKESDCYALGMVIFEVLSGRAPFAPCTVPVIIQKVMEGKRPERPQGDEGMLFTDAIWTTLELCWKHQAGDRTDAKAVLSCLEGNPPQGRSSSPDVGGDVETDTEDLSDETASKSSMRSMFHLRLALHYLLRYNRSAYYTWRERTPSSITQSTFKVQRSKLPDCAGWGSNFGYATNGESTGGVGW